MSESKEESAKDKMQYFKSLTAAERQAGFRERRDARERHMANTLDKARKAFSDVIDHLVIVTTAYETLADKRGTDKLKNYRSAINRARNAYEELFGESAK